MDLPVLIVAGVAALCAAVLALVVHAFRRSFEALSADARVARLVPTLGGAAVGPLQWIAQRGSVQAGLLVVTGSSGINRVSVWLGRRAAAPPRLVLGILHEYDEPLRRAFRDGEVDRIVLRPRSRWFRWMRPSALAGSALGDLAADLRVASTAPDDVVRSCLAQPEVHGHVRGALAVGFDEIVLYPPHGVELVAHAPRAHMIDPEVVHAALGWIEPMAGALGRIS